MKTHFEWDPAKDAENQRKHGISFTRAQYALRTIAESLRAILHVATPKNAFIASVKWTEEF